MSETKRARPLSPHLQIYRWPVTMATSITHRATGIANYAGAFLLTCWLLALAAGPQAYATAQNLISSWIGTVILVGYTWSLIYHTLNGLRHLHWDAGLLFDNAKAEKSGLIIIGLSLALTALFWLLAL